MVLTYPMTKRFFAPVLPCLAGIAATLLIGGSPAMAASATPATHPNVVILLIDDMGYGDISAHGNPYLQTPNLDALRADSARFTDFHVTPMCSPSRGQLLTGRCNLVNAASSVNSGRHLLRPDFPTMADIFRDQGYATGIFGKWHLGDSYPYRPIDRGFDTSVSFSGSSLGTARDYWGNDGFDDTLLRNGVSEKMPGYVPDVFQREAEAWMLKQKKEGRPFFCYLPSIIMHGPEFVTEEMMAPYKKYGKTRARLYAYLKHYDDNLAELLKFLKENGLDDNTILVFFSDNGGVSALTEVWNAGMRGCKKQLYEGGHHVPLFVNWAKGGIKPRDIGGLTDVVDLFPTLMDLCDLHPTKKPVFDGISLASVLRGADADSLNDRSLVVQYSTHTGSHGKAEKNAPRYGDAAVLWRNWRLVHGKELYDLSSDPGQKNNLMASRPDIAKKLQEMYKNWWDKMEPDKVPIQEVVVGSPHQNPVPLDISEWEDTWIDFSNSVRSGEPANGRWHVRVDRPGKYRFTLRRWPEMTHLPMRAATPSTGWPYVDGKSLPVHSVTLKVGDQEVTRPVGPEDQSVDITLDLIAGSTTLQTWMRDEQGKDLAGVYYVDVEKL